MALPVSLVSQNNKTSRKESFMNTKDCQQARKPEFVELKGGSTREFNIGVEVEVKGTKEFVEKR